MRFRATMMVGCVVCLCACVSCTLPGFVADSFMPEKKVKPAYEPIDQKTLVFVDDPRHALPTGQTASLIAEQVAVDLKREEVISEFVSLALLEELRANEAGFEGWAIDKVGERVGARQVIYVLIDAFDTAGAGHELARPTASARVKIVDVASGRRLFPERGELGVSSLFSSKQLPIVDPSSGAQEAMARRLALRLGEDLGKKFYEHKPRAVGSGFEE